MKYTASVIKGKGRGKGIGFPTFNLEIPPGFNLETGIYACWVWIENVQHKGAMHFGPIPTFNETAPSLEIFVLDFSPNPLIPLVTSITFSPVKFLRPIRSFNSPEALSQQITKDVALIQQFLS